MSIYFAMSWTGCVSLIIFLPVRTLCSLLSLPLMDVYCLGTISAIVSGCRLWSAGLECILSNQNICSLVQLWDFGYSATSSIWVFRLHSRQEGRDKSVSHLLFHFQLVLACDSHLLLGSSSSEQEHMWYIAMSAFPVFEFMVFVVTPQYTIDLSRTADLRVLSSARSMERPLPSQLYRPFKNLQFYEMRRGCFYELVLSYLTFCRLH